MSPEIILSNLLSPSILFFWLGIAAALIKSDLEFPQSIAKFFSIYLLVSIGFRGGVEISHSPVGVVVLVALASIITAAIIPVYSYYIFRLRLDVPNAAALCAVYGSVSAVTFLAATDFLQRTGVPYGGYMIAAMALMESPAIVVGVLLSRLNSSTTSKHMTSYKELFREAFFNGSVVLLLGSLVIGLLVGDKGGQALAPFTINIFPGLLALFLLDMGIVSGKRLKDLLALGAPLLSLAVVVPMLNAVLGIVVAKVIGLGIGDGFLFVVLSASASYIAVPAAVRLAIPSANPSVFLPMALALTFPFNISIGFPIYFSLAKYILE